ncbi:MAG: 2-hydroxyacyl-CoA dehydratase family protein, partial [Mycetocola sp.]
MSETITAEAAFDSMVRAAEDPTGYVVRWRESTGRRAVGVFPMNFPSEIVHATGLLPVVVQEDRVPITVGNNLISEFNCGYTRNLADQVAGGRLDVFDAFYMVDHCIELIGAADVIRELSPKPFYFGQLISSMDDPWTGDQARITIADLVQEIGRFAGAAISEDQLRSSIESFNRGRSLMRKIFQDRRSGNAYFTATQLQVLVKSSMIMAREEHNTLLEVIVAEAGDQPRDERVRV